MRKMNEKIKVMVSGFPGKKAMEIATEIIKHDDFELINYCLGNRVSSTMLIPITDAGKTLTVIPYNERHRILFLKKRPDVIIDIRDNGELENEIIRFYAKNGYKLITDSNLENIESIRKQIIHYSSEGTIFSRLVFLPIQEIILAVRDLFLVDQPGRVIEMNPHL